VFRARNQALEAWASGSARKPLVVRGARQVGKSWLIRDFGTRRFGGLAEVNLERRPELRACFEDNDPRATLRQLEVLLRRAIPADGTCALFLDEIQAAPEVLSKLRWFAEELPALPVIAAGSLLDFALAAPEVSVPVGRITFLHLEPLGFEEFCLAVGEGPLLEWLRGGVTIESIRDGTAMPAALHEHALQLYRTWLLVGGMPAAVDAYRTERRLAEVAALQRDLLATLRDDFAKYSGRVPHRRLAAVLASVPRQLGAKFSFVEVDREERAAALRQAVELLCKARVCHRVQWTAARGIPLAAGSDERRFKLLALDVGLASCQLGLDLAALEEVSDPTLVNKGALAEQAVGQLLRLTFAANEEPVSFWWQREKAGSQAEVDYVHAHGARVVPIEVKSGKSGTLRSLHRFMAERGLDWAVRVNASAPVVERVAAGLPGQPTFAYDLLSIPAYLVEQHPRLLRETG
jgi:predicted AAA+ superfamily ATPase